MSWSEAGGWACGVRGGRWWSSAGRILCAGPVGVVVVVLGMCASASAATFTWAGEAGKGSPGWGQGANWQGGVAPSLPGPVSLVFPRLTGSACEQSPPSDTCYLSDNTVEGLSVESLQIDDGDEYEVEGDGISLSSGGLTASPAAGSQGPAGDILTLPITLAEPQSWSIAGRSGGRTGENGLALGGAVTGSGALTVNLKNGAAFYPLGGMEVGPLTLQGSAGAEAFVGLEGKLNNGNRHAVSVSHATLFGEGATGPLSMDAATIVPFGLIEADSMTLDSASTVAISIIGAGKAIANSRLDAHGPVELGGAKLTAEQGPASEGGACPSLSAGQTFTLVETSGTLSGAFGNVKEGEYIPLVAREGCNEIMDWSLRITYDRSGAVQTVRGEVGQAKPPIPENKATKYESETESWMQEEAQKAAEEEMRLYEAKVASEEAKKRKEREEAEPKASVQQAPGEPAPVVERSEKAKALRCHVPSLEGDSLSKAKRALSRAHCSLGKVTRLHAKPHAALVVLRQQPRHGRWQATGTKIAITLGAPRGHAHRR